MFQPILAYIQLQHIFLALFIVESIFPSFKKDLSVQILIWKAIIKISMPRLPALLHRNKSNKFHGDRLWCWQNPSLVIFIPLVTAGQRPRFKTFHCPSAITFTFQNKLGGYNFLTFRSFGLFWTVQLTKSFSLWLGCGIPLTFFCSRHGFSNRWVIFTANSCEYTKFGAVLLSLFSLRISRLVVIFRFGLLIETVIKKYLCTTVITVRQGLSWA